MSAALVERPATWMARAVREREVSAVELFEAHAARIAERDPAINALVLPRLDEAREEAVAADTVAPSGPLHGVPFTCKDPFPVAGMRAPNGSKLLADHVSDADCAPVAAMRAAGAILLGKTNVSEFASWWDSVNPLFGATANPHDHSRTAGGSSGGEAAAIASGMSPLGLGSDLGGSIRNPCHFVGLFGLKPGRDCLPGAEHAPLPAGPGIRAMGVIGPMGAHRRRPRARAGRAGDPAAESGRAPGADRGLRGGRSAAGLARVPRGGATDGRGARHLRAGRGRAAQPPRGARRDGRHPRHRDCERDAGHRRRSLLELSPYLQEMFREGRDPLPGPAQYVDALARLAQYEAEADEWFREHPVALCPCAPDVAPPLGGRWPAEIDGVPMRPAASSRSRPTRARSACPRSASRSCAPKTVGCRSAFS
jgi:Asp-tRNA(Asn)/Glu-tRNA(Gln) amidotransferase A subunit family amidase